MSNTATDEQREYLISLASQLSMLVSHGDPIASKISREAKLHDMTYDRAETLTHAVEDAIRALEGGNVIVGPWGEEHYRQ